MEEYQLEESDEEVTVLVGVGSPKNQGEQFQVSELPRVLNLEKESNEHFK